MHSHSPLSPHTGKRASPQIPAAGLGKIDDVLYVRYMDSWDALRRNLDALLQAAQDGLISGPSGVLQLEAVTGVGKSTLYRILDPREKNPTQIDTLEKIAKAYNLHPWQLLVPRLDPLDPPATIGGQRMSVLRSVFAQTHNAAFNSPNEATEAPPAPKRPQGGSVSDTGHSAPSGGSTVESDHRAAPRATRHRRPKTK